MGAPISLDLRERVVAAASGMSRRAAAEHYQVSESSAIRWTARAAQIDSPAALPMGGKKPFTLADEADWTRARLAEKPDITGRELLAELHERKIDVSYYAVSHFLDRSGLARHDGRYPALHEHPNAQKTLRMAANTSRRR
jgi:transposase